MRGTGLYSTITIKNAAGYIQESPLDYGVLSNQGYVRENGDSTRFLVANAMILMK